MGAGFQPRGAGDLVGPGSSTVNAIATYADSTGKILQDSGITISGANEMVFPTVTTTTATVLDLANADSLTTGSIVVFGSDSADTSARSLVKIVGSNVLATNAIGFEISSVNIHSMLVERIVGGFRSGFKLNTANNGNSVVAYDNDDGQSYASFYATSLTPSRTGSGFLGYSNYMEVAYDPKGTFGFGNAMLLNTDSDFIALLDVNGNQHVVFDTATGNLGINNKTPGTKLDIVESSNSASDVYAVTITSDNAGAGNPGGIDMSSFSVDEPLIKALADVITTAGTVSHQVAIDIGGTTFYLVAHTHGS